MENDWENSQAKVFLQHLVQHKLDKYYDGTDQRANVVYTMREAFSDFPQKFFTKQLQKIRKKSKAKPPSSKEKEPGFEEIVSLEELEEEWTNSHAKAALERIVEAGKDKKEDGNNQRVDVLYKRSVEFKHFPSKFFTKKLQKLRKEGKAKPSSQDPELKIKWGNSRAMVVLQRIVEHGLDCKDDGSNKPSDEVFKMSEEFKLFP